MHVIIMKSFGKTTRLCKHNNSLEISFSAEIDTVIPPDITVICSDNLTSSDPILTETNLSPGFHQNDITASREQLSCLD